MIFKSEDSINFLNFFDYLILNFSRKIIIFFIIILLIIILFRVSLQNIKDELMETHLKLEQENKILEIDIKQIKNLIQQKEHPINHYFLIEQGIKILSDKAKLTELDYTYPLLTIRGRAKDENSLSEITLKSEKSSSEKIDSSILRTDYRTNPGFILKVKFRGELDEQ